MLGRIEREVADPIQDEAVRITAAEAVDSGLMAASWRVVPQPRSVLVANKAFSEDNHAPYPAFQEHGYRHHQSGKHMPARHILARAIDIAQHLS